MLHSPSSWSRSLVLLVLLVLQVLVESEGSKAFREHKVRVALVAQGEISVRRVFQVRPGRRVQKVHKVR